MIKWVCIALLSLAAAPMAFAQQIALPYSQLESEGARAKAMPELARKTLAAYRESDRDKYLDQAFRLQMVAGRYADAEKSIVSLRELRRASGVKRTDSLFLQYQIFANAKAAGIADKQPFEQAYQRSFRELYGRLDDRTAQQAARSFGANLGRAQDDLSKAIEQQKGTDSIALADAMELVRKYQFAEVYQASLPLTEALIAEDDRRRYVIQDDVLINTPGGATLSAIVVRPKASSAPQPTLLGFTIYVYNWSLDDAKEVAANGYVGVIAFSRGKKNSPDAIEPYEHDGEDARAVIDWISKQPWSDGRVGMYGGSYNGFTQWAAAKRLPAALKAIMPSVPVAPGIDLPMEGNVFMTFPYRWFPYVANNKTLDDAVNNDNARWDGLNRNWYTRGQPYRSLERIDGKPNPLFHRWLEHPSYDAYWQSLIPYAQDFAKIDIPVLTTSGYYDGCLISALYYFTQHAKYNPHADHTLLIGPYDHMSGQHRAANTLSGYELDPVAVIDIHELRYQWFDYVLKGGEKPALLKDKVNYQVMGANEWKHAPSIDAMSDGSLRLHLSPDKSGDTYRLSDTLPEKGAAIGQTVDFADRSDIDAPVPAWGVISAAPDTRNGLVFVSDPIAASTEVSGLFSGELDFVVNKKDMDVNVALYELMPDGRYFQLSYYVARASYAADRSHRKLLQPGKRQRLAFRSGRPTSRKMLAGSRLVAVLSIVKQPDMQINYGTGREVSDESIADAKVPLQIEWYGSSYIEVPVSK